jgi:hypothetical protein
MNIKNYPAQYASAFSPVVFDISNVQGDKSQGVDINILLKGKTTPVGVKHFFNTTTMSVNIAPYAQSYLSISPQRTGDLQLMPQRAVAMALSANGITSEYRFVAAGREALPSEVVLSEWTKRTISMGEVDEFSFIPPSEEIWVEIHSEDIVGRHHATRLAPFFAEEGVVTCTVNTQELARIIEQESKVDTENLAFIRYSVYYGAELAFEVHYKVVKPTGGVRLAWINRYGMIDCYTFPTITEEQTIVKRQAERSNGEKMVFPIDRAWEQTTISSGLQPQLIITTLANIVASPKVWQWKDDKWSECIVTDSALTTHRADEPCVINLTIRPSKNINTQSL